MGLVVDYTIPSGFTIPSDISEKWREIINAITHLQAKEEKVTYRSIRAITGASFSTIRDCLNYLREKFGLCKRRNRRQDVLEAFERLKREGLKPTYRAIAQKIRCSFSTIAAVLAKAATSIVPQKHQAKDHGCEAVIACINEYSRRFGREYKLTRRLRRKLKRLLDKYTIEEVIEVIRFKAGHWCNAKFHSNLNPKTIFAHFDRYYDDYQEAGAPTTTESVPTEAVSNEIFDTFQQVFEIELPSDLLTEEYEDKAEYILWLYLSGEKQIYSPIGFLKTCTIEHSETKWRGFVKEYKASLSKIEQPDDFSETESEYKDMENVVKQFFEVNPSLKTSMTNQAIENLLSSPMYRGRSDIDTRSEVFQSLVTAELYKLIKQKEVVA